MSTSRLCGRCGLPPPSRCLACALAANPRGAESPAEAAQAIAKMAEQLRPDWQQPERFFEAKSALIYAARALAETLKGT
jgi:hypothetical protein